MTDQSEQTAEQAAVAQDAGADAPAPETKVEETPAPTPPETPPAADPLAAVETPAVEEFAPEPGVGGTRHGLEGIAAGPADHPRTRALAEQAE